MFLQYELLKFLPMKNSNFKPILEPYIVQNRFRNIRYSPCFRYETFELSVIPPNLGKMDQSQVRILTNFFWQLFLTTFFDNSIILMIGEVEERNYVDGKLNGKATVLYTDSSKEMRTYKVIISSDN